VIGCRSLGELYEQTQDFPNALMLFQHGCDHDEPSSCVGLGNLYSLGRGVERDYDRARQLFERGCTASIASGCFNLAATFASGLGVARDRNRARELFERACRLGDPRGCAVVRPQAH
jgi:TPR repeat protein